MSPQVRGRDAEKRVAGDGLSRGHHLFVRGRAGLGSSIHGLGQDETGGPARHSDGSEGEVAGQMRPRHGLGVISFEFLNFNIMKTAVS